MKSIYLPKDRRTVNAWNRFYYNTHPVIGNFVDSIVENVCCDFKLKGTNKKELEIYKNNLFDKKKGFKYKGVVRDIIKEFNIIGEAVTYINFNEGDGVIDNVTLQNPDFIELKNNILTEGVSVYMIPDASFRKLCNSKKKEDIEIVKQIPKKVLEYVKSGKNVPLDLKFVSVLQRLQNKYDVRGTSFICKYYKQLIYEDKSKKKIVGKILREEIEREQFSNQLERQREVLEGWMIKNLFNPIKAVNKLKTIPEIVWTKKIDTKKMWK